MVSEWQVYYRLRIGDFRVIFWLDQEARIIYADYIGPEGISIKPSSLVLPRPLRLPVVSVYLLLVSRTLSCKVKVFLPGQGL